MKKLIISFALGFVALTATVAQDNTNTIEIVKTFKVDGACNIVSPTGSPVSIIKDNSLPKGVVKSVLIVRHNAQPEKYNDIVSRRVWAVQDNDTKTIGFDADPRQVTGRNGFELREEFELVVYMSADTARMK